MTNSPIRSSIKGSVRSVMRGQGSRLDAPLVHIMTSASLVRRLSGELTWTRASNATYVDRNGVLQYAGIDEPRQEKDGWLIEGGSTNLITYSNDFSNSAWQRYSGTVITANDIKSPDGMMNGAKISTGITYASLRQAAGITPNSVFSLSVYVKRGNYTSVELAVTASGGTGLYEGVDYNFDTGVLDIYSDDYGTATATATELSDGWVRLTFTDTDQGGNTSITFQVQSPSYEREPDYYVYAAFAQAESLPFTTSYIPTEDSPVTRLGDIVSIPAEGNLPSAGEPFSVLARAAFPDSPGSHTVFGVGNRDLHLFLATNDRLAMRIIDVNGVSVYAQTVAGYIERNKQYTFTVTFNEGVCMLFVDGVNVDQTLTADTPVYSTLDEVCLGSLTASGPLYSTEQDFRIYDFALNEQEVKFLTGE